MKSDVCFETLKENVRNLGGFIKKDKVEMTTGRRLKC